MTTDCPAPRRRRRTLTLILFSGVVAVAGAWFYSAYWLQRPIGSGPAGPEVPRRLFAEVWSERPVELLGFGDSITAGFGASAGHSYFDRLLSNPADDPADVQGCNLTTVLPNLRSANDAVSGSDSLEHHDRMLPQIQVRSEDTFGIIVATIGGNDVIHMYGRAPPREGAMYGATMAQAGPWIEGFEERLKGILETISKRFPGGCHIFLANIYDPTDGSGDISNTGLPAWPDGLSILAAYNDVIARTANLREDTTLIDIHRCFLGHGIHCRQFWHSHYDSADPHYWYFDNLEDPNDRGYDAIRRLFLIAMARVLPDSLHDDESSPAMKQAVAPIPPDAGN